MESNIDIRQQSYEIKYAKLSLFTQLALEKMVNPVTVINNIINEITADANSGHKNAYIALLGLLVT